MAQTLLQTTFLEGSTSFGLSLSQWRGVDRCGQVEGSVPHHEFLVLKEVSQVPGPWMILTRILSSHMPDFPGFLSFYVIPGSQQGEVRTVGAGS